MGGNPGHGGKAPGMFMILQRDATKVRLARCGVEDYAFFNIFASMTELLSFVRVVRKLISRTDHHTGVEIGTIVVQTPPSIHVASAILFAGNVGRTPALLLANTRL